MEEKRKFIVLKGKRITKVLLGISFVFIFIAALLNTSLSNSSSSIGDYNGLLSLAGVSEAVGEGCPMEHFDDIVNNATECVCQYDPEDCCNCW